MAFLNRARGKVSILSGLPSNLSTLQIAGRLGFYVLDDLKHVLPLLNEFSSRIYELEYDVCITSDDVQLPPMENLEFLGLNALDSTGLFFSHASFGSVHPFSISDKLAELLNGRKITRLSVYAASEYFETARQY